ncbi:C39 family peptidase [Phormidesmis priestleyi]
MSQKSQPQEDDKPIKAGTLLNLKSYQFDENDLQVVLEQEMEGTDTWFLKQKDAMIVEKNDIVVPSVKKLDVPYYSQLNNLHKPTGSSSLTSLAMALDFLGASRKRETGQFADELYEYCEKQGLSRHDPYDLAKVAEAYKCKDNFSVEANFLEIKDWLARGNPVVVHGYFTDFGHVVCIVGFNKKGFIVNDSWGQLIHSFGNQSYDIGKNGNGLTYSYNLIYKLCCPGFWVHFLSKPD